VHHSTWHISEVLNLSDSVFLRVAVVGCVRSLLVSMPDYPEDGGNRILRKMMFTSSLRVISEDWKATFMNVGNAAFSSVVVRATRNWKIISCSCGPKWVNICSQVT